MRMAESLMQAAWMIARCEECAGHANNTMKVEDKRGRLAACALVISSQAVVSVPNHTKAQVLANAWNLASCMRNHLQSMKTANSSPVVIDTPEPAVYIH